MTDPSDSLAQIAAMIESSHVELGIDPEERPFRPHLTIARVRPEESGTITDVDARFAELARSGPIDFEVDHVTLYRSELGRGGPKYTAVERFDLRN